MMYVELYVFWAKEFKFAFQIFLARAKKSYLARAPKKSLFLHDVCALEKFWVQIRIPRPQKPYIWCVICIYNEK